MGKFLGRFKFGDLGGGGKGDSAMRRGRERIEGKCLVVDDSEPPQVHLWLTPPTVDAGAGAMGERPPGRSAGGDPDWPEERRARQDQRDPTGFAGPNAENEMPLASFEQTSEPRRLYDRRDATGPSPASTPASSAALGQSDLDVERERYIDSRSLRISGRDQRGERWDARIWGPDPQPGGESFPKDIEPGMARDARRLLTNLERGDSGNAHVAALGQYQRLLDNFYRR
jgi:hypothetical protein